MACGASSPVTPRTRRRSSAWPGWCSGLGEDLLPGSGRRSSPTATLPRCPTATPLGVYRDAAQCLPRRRSVPTATPLSANRRATQLGCEPFCTAALGVEGQPTSRAIHSAVQDEPIRSAFLTRVLRSGSALLVEGGGL